MLSSTSVLDIRASQIQYTIENSFFSEEATITIEGQEAFKIRGIHKWGPGINQMGTKLDRFGTEHSFALCSYSLPNFATKEQLVKTSSSIEIGDTVYRILQISESFAKYSLKLSPKKKVVRNEDTN